MSGGFEVAGDAITGAIVGRAVEPGHGETGETHAAAHATCLNCGQALIGGYCHACGQAAHIHRTIGAIFHDIAHGVFHFEGKIWRTLPMLAWRPGELTRRYIHGERATFVSPLALFLFCVFLMFGVVSGLAGEMHTPEISPVNRAKSAPQIEAELKVQNARSAALAQEIKAAEVKDLDTAALEARQNNIESEITGLEIARDYFSGKKWTAVGFKTGWKSLDAGIEKANENPNLLLYKLQSSAYKYSWALIPLSTPFVWLLFFWQRKYKLYDHAIFVIYSLSFMLLLVVTLTIAGFAGLGEPVVPLLAVGVPPLFTYRQLRGAYRIGRFSAIVRTVLLMTFGIVVLSLFLSMLLALGMMG